MIFVAGDQAIYEGAAVRNEQGIAFGGVLVRGVMVTVVQPNEDDEDDVIVQPFGETDVTYRVEPNELNWRGGRS